MKPAALDFVEPPWEAPLDAGRQVAAIASNATISGMFFLALVEGAKRRNVTLGFSRDRYLPFGFYPLREFGSLLIEAAQSFYPELSLRQALRRIGTVGPAALLSSTLGKVTLGASTGVHEAVMAMAKTYSVNVRPSRCEVTGTQPRSLIVELDVPYFVDSHHVGVFEGTMVYAGAAGKVRVQRRSETSASFLLEW